MASFWDYWWREGDAIWNATLIEGVIVDGPHRHSELPDIPYIIIEHDHEPGNPDGISTVEPLLDLQVELNRLMTHWYQHIADNVDTAWQATGNDGMNIEPGAVPKANEILPVGDARIEPIANNVNTMPFGDAVGRTWEAMHRISGLPEVLFGSAPSDISGRTLAVQIQSATNRMDPRRGRLYRGLMRLLDFWMFMATQKDPKLPLGMNEDGTERQGSLAELVKGFNRWKIVSPELTPRDSQELVATELNKVNGGLSSRRTSMDAIGQESPEAEQDLMRQEKSDIVLNPSDVQQTFSGYALMVQVSQALQQMQADIAGLQAQAQASGQGGGVSVETQAAQTQNNAQQQQFAAQPSVVGEDQNQPITQAGMPPPAGGQGPALQTLVRAGGAAGGQALNQMSFGGV